MSRNSTHLIRTVLGVAASVGIAGAASAAPFTGPTSPYYLDNWNEQTIYVVQGTNVINSFPWSYGANCSAFYCEGNLAISNGTVNTNWFGNGYGSPGSAGQYTLGGTPTGVSWTDSSPPPPTTIEDFYDGTSDGTHNYTVQWANDIGVTNVVAYDLQWQNPAVLFPLSNGIGTVIGITYDSADNALWIGGWGINTLWEYSLTGTLLKSFAVVSSEPVGLAYDSADNTLWFSDSESGILDQYSKSGTLLQSGTPSGLSGCCYLAGEIAGPSVPPPLPEPGSLALVGTGLAGLWVALRRRSRPAA